MTLARGIQISNYSLKPPPSLTVYIKDGTDANRGEPVGSKPQCSYATCRNRGIGGAYIAPDIIVNENEIVIYCGADQCRHYKVPD
ncbi:MAG: hypothetical protein GF368_00325 [Candidatus Aenigmarchaeota archaeon]|nr:hypothetical protein [Candidatus Aenigmarchaeota archaeon]